MPRRKQITLEKIHLYTAGAKGVSIGKTNDGKTVIVKNAIPGDVVDVRVTKKKRRYLEGKAIQVHQYSKYRTNPECKHFGLCGGCKWQNMEYSAQLSFKENEVKENLQRIGGFQNVQINPILPSKQQYWYRNKLEFSFSNARWVTEEEIQLNQEIENKNALGFHIPGMWSKVLDIEKCYLQSDFSNQIKNAIRAYAVKNNLPFFDLRNQKGLLRTLMIRTSNLGETMVLIQFFKEDKKAIENLLNFIKNTFPSITTLLYAVNPKGNDSVYDLEIKCFFGDGFIQEKMKDLIFRIGPKSFFQTNSKQAIELYDLTKEFADLTGTELVYDLYTGTGTIAQFIAQHAQRVIGVESVEEAIISAKENAKRNRITNCEFICGDMKEVLNDDFVEKYGKPDVIITDPPRDGMHKKVVENMLKIKPSKVVYVSCNSATQARDLNLMKDLYEITKVQPVDMFPQTHHVENIVLLSLK